MKLGSYAAHPDPATATACFIAVVLGANGPFYPLYVVAVVGWAHGDLAFLTMIATPLFLAIPLIARRDATSGRIALWLIGTVNTVWCMKLFGPASGVGIFLLPCIALATMLPAGLPRLAGAGLPLLPLLVPKAWFGTPLMPLSAAQSAHLALLNQFSAACLMGLVALRLGHLLAEPASRSPAPGE